MVIGSIRNILLEFLKVVGAGDVRFEFKDAQTAGQLRPDEPADSEYKYSLHRNADEHLRAAKWT